MNEAAKDASGRSYGARLESRRISETNARAFSNRPFLAPDYEFRPASTHDKAFQELKRVHPYFGYIDVEIEGVEPFVMFSCNDDRVAQTYFWYGPDAFESYSLRLWRELVRRSEVVFDVGAFTGVYSLAAHRTNANAKVYAFEPIKRVFGRLLDNLKVNRLARKVLASDLALGDADGEAVMKMFSGQGILSSGSSLVPKKGKEVHGGEHVRTMRLDTFVRENGVRGVNLAKIDVEGAEGLVIDGMRETLRAHRPHLLVEVFSKDKLRGLLDRLSPHGYSFAVVDEWKQRAYVNDIGAHTGVSNVLFSATPAAELEAFCRSVGPLRGSAERLRRYRASGDLGGQLQQLSAEVDAMRRSRGWRVAAAVNAAVGRARGLLKG